MTDDLSEGAFGGFTPGDTVFGGPEIGAEQALTPDLFSDGDTFFAPALTTIYALTAALYEDADTFFSATVANLNTLVPALYSDADTFHSATITVGAVNLAPSLFSDGDTFFSATLAATYTLAPSLYSDADTFHQSALTATYALVPSLYSDADTFHTAALAVGAVNLAPSLFSDGDTFFSATITTTYALAPSLYSDADTFFGPTAVNLNTLVPALYSDADTFFSPAITVGAVNLAPDLFVDGDTFYDPIVRPVSTIRPDADVSDGGWLNELGSNVDLYASVDEADPDDGDYIRSSNNPSGDIVRLRLSDHLSTPTEPYFVRYRFQRGGALVGGTVQLKARLLEGGSTVVEWTHNDISTSFVEVEQELTAPEFASITDFSNLNVELEATYAA